MIRKTGKQVSCPECGAVFDAAETRCPYCGHIHEKGAERAFFAKLEEKREQLDRVDDAAREDYKEEWKRGSRSVLKRVLIAGAVLLLLVVVFLKQQNDLWDEDRDYAQEMVWQHEHFPEFDRLYQEGNIKELLELIYRYGEEGHDVWEWSHYDEVTAMDTEETP